MCIGIGGVLLPMYRIHLSLRGRIRRKKRRIRMLVIQRNGVNGGCKSFRSMVVQTSCPETISSAQPRAANVTYFRDTMLYPNERYHSERPLSSRAFSSARE